MPEDYYGLLPEEAGLLQALLAGEQGLPTEQPVQAIPADTGPAPVDPTLAAYFQKIGLDPAMAATLGDDDMKRMAYYARQDAYDTKMRAELERTGKLQGIGTMYEEANPQDYYNTFGTIPIMSLGKSRFGIDEKTGTWDTAQGAEGIKYLTPDQTATYTLYSPRTGKTLGSGAGAEGLLSLAQMATGQTAEKDRKADWQLIKTPAEGGDPEIIASNLYNTNLSTLGKIVAAGLPIATAFIPGLNLAGAIAAGAGAGGLSAAMKEQNILKGALIGGATAGLVNAPVLPGGGSIAQSIGRGLQGAGSGTGQAAAQAVGDEIVVQGLSKLAQAGGSALGQGAVGSLLNAATPAADEIVVRGNLGGGLDLATLAPTLGAGTLGAALAAAQPGPVNYGDQVYDQPTQDIVVEGARPITPPVTPPPLSLGDIATLPAAATLAPNTSNITEPSTLKPGEDNLLRDIMRYYSLGSGVLDALGVGQGGGAGSAGMGTPYTSQLGVLPTFTRGAFTPFQGDYETYGQGPEFNFFGGAQTNG